MSTKKLSSSGREENRIKIQLGGNYGLAGNGKGDIISASLSSPSDISWKEGIGASGN